VNFLAWRARSLVILAAAAALCVGWVLSLVWYAIGGHAGLTWGYAIIDAGLAAFFWRLSRNRVFPAALFHLHAFLVCYYLYVSIVGSSAWRVATFINRVFELALLYGAGGSIWRIRHLPARKEEARLRRASDDPSLLRAAQAAETGAAFS
jgi:predicted membrane protein